MFQTSYRLLHGPFKILKWREFSVLVFFEVFENQLKDLCLIFKAILISLAADQVTNTNDVENL